MGANHKVYEGFECAGSASLLKFAKLRYISCKRFNIVQRWKVNTAPVTTFTLITVACCSAVEFGISLTRQESDKAEWETAY